MKNHAYENPVLKELKGRYRLANSIINWFSTGIISLPPHVVFGGEDF
jgi:hypothetical protein